MTYVLEMVIFADPQFSNKNCLHRSNEDLQVEVLHSDAIVNSLQILFRFMIDCLEMKLITHEPDPEKQRIWSVLFNHFHDNADNTNTPQID